MSDYYSESSHSLPLFDFGEHAAKTRADAFIAAQSKTPERQRLILSYLIERGPLGAIRHEIADHFNWPLSSVCRPVLELLQAGVVQEIGTRTSPYGSPAAVIVAKGVK